MLDPSIFSRIKTKQDFDQERSEFEARKRQRDLQEQLGQVKLAQAQSPQPDMPFSGTGFDAQLVNRAYQANLQKGLDPQMAEQQAIDAVLQTKQTYNPMTGQMMKRNPLFGTPSQVNQMQPSDVMTAPMPPQFQDVSSQPMNFDAMIKGMSQPDLPQQGLPEEMVDPTQIQPSTQGLFLPGQQDVLKEAAKADIRLQEEEIKGQKQRQTEKIAEDFAFEMAMSQKGAVDDSINKIVDQVSAYNTGVLGSRNPFSQSGANIESLMNTVRSDATLTRLVELKKSGGTLGQVTERELALLESSKAALARIQDPLQFIQELKKYQTQRDASIDAIADAYRTQFGQYPTGFTQPREVNRITAEEFLSEGN